MGTIWKAYNAANTGHKAFTTSTLPHNTGGEVWVGGPVMYISIGMWKAMRKTLGKTDNYFD